MKERAKALAVRCNRLGEYFIVMVLDKPPAILGKTHNGASVGIDLGQRKCMTLRETARWSPPPWFPKGSLGEFSRWSRYLSRCVGGSRNREWKHEEPDRRHGRECCMMSDFLGKLAHGPCRRCCTIILADQALEVMCRRWGRKFSDLAVTTSW